MLKLRGRHGLKFKALPLVLAGYYLLGKRWNDFYSWMLDRQERGVTIDDIMRNTSGPSGKERGLYDLSVAGSHLEILRRVGLKPDSKLLDFGCGFGRSAGSIVPYLDPGHYVGVDLSAERIRMAREYMERLELENKRAEFLVEPRSNDLTFLGEKRFDYVWSKAVFVHMPFSNVQECLGQIHKVLKNDGTFVGDIGIRETFQRFSVKDFFITEWGCPGLC